MIMWSLSKPIKNVCTNKSNSTLNRQHRLVLTSALNAEAIHSIAIGSVFFTPSDISAILSYSIACGRLIFMGESGQIKRAATKI